MDNCMLRATVVAAVAVCGLSVSVAHAEFTAGTLLFQTQGQSHAWQAGVDGSTEWTDHGYSFTGAKAGDGWSTNWQMQASMTPHTQAFTSTQWFINCTDSIQTYQTFYTQPLTGTFGPGSLVGGSIAFSFTDLNGDGVSVGAVDGGSIYTAFVDGTTADPFDGTVIDTLLNDATGSAGLFQTGNFAATAFGDAPSLPSMPFDGAGTNFGILVEFTLSPGDSAAFTATMAIATPAPGALAVFGLAGLTRRRRRSTD